jgi:putative addiction module killer protein
MPGSPCRRPEQLTLNLSVDYSSHMVEIFSSETFDAWFSGLRDRVAAIRIQARIDRLARGNPGDVKPVGEGISELRVDHGPGYRVYFMRRGVVVVVLLCGGDKSSQAADIQAAKRIAQDWKD